MICAGNNSVKRKPGQTVIHWQKWLSWLHRNTIWNLPAESATITSVTKNANELSLPGTFNNLFLKRNFSLIPKMVARCTCHDRFVVSSGDHSIMITSKPVI